MYAGQIDVATIAERTRDDDLAADVSIFFNFKHKEAHEATVNEYGVADLNVFREAWVVEVDSTQAVFAEAANALPEREVDVFAFFQFESLGYIASADFRPLDVHHDRDMSIDALTYGAHSTDDFAGPCMVRMCHVDAADVNTCLDEPF